MSKCVDSHRFELSITATAVAGPETERKSTELFIWWEKCGESGGSEVAVVYPEELNSILITVRLGRVGRKGKLFSG